MDCLKDLLQISKDGCECLNIVPEIGQLYLDSNIEGRIPLSAAVIDCSDPSLTDMLNNMRDNAFDSFNQLLLMQIKGFGSRYPDISGHLPQKDSYNTSLQTLGYNYMIIKPKCVSGLMGVITIKSENNEQVYQIIDGVATAVTGDIEIEIESGKEYVFYFQPSQNVYNKRPDCGCGGSPQWKRYFEIGMGTTDDPNNIEKGDKQYMYGFDVTFHMFCDPLIHLCSQKSGWSRNTWLLTYLYGVLYQWRKAFAYWILTSGQVTNYLTTNGEELPALIELYDSKIEERLIYLAQNYSGSDCVNCGSIYKGSILI